MSKKDVVVIYKHSRYSYLLDRGTEAEKRNLLNRADQISQDLLIAHEKNLDCIARVTTILHDLRITYHAMCRADMKRSDLENRFVIAIGGDGTMLDCSHYCDDSPILGVNSDPDSSIGALCAANVTNFRDVIREIWEGKLLPTRLTRLRVTVDGRAIEPLAMNDVLFCHKNPASLSRFSISLNGHEEAHRSSGMWIATAAGSTGGIYSAGATPLPLDDESAIFHVREPYWADALTPQLLSGKFSPSDSLIIRSTMTDGEIFIDGPHERRDLAWGATVEITSDAEPLWLFDGPRLDLNRKKIIERRSAIRGFLG
jgi:NAD+ kinase